MKNSIVVFLLFLTTVVTAEERILDFQSTVVVNKNRSVDVTEVIVVSAEGINIQRGIFRDIITTRVNDRGRRKYLRLSVTEVLKNGIAEKYVVEKVNNVDRIKIGNANILLDHDTYTYTIRYTLEQQVRFFETYDEVYWNVTGNDWQFQIDKARVEIMLPSDAIISQHAGYSGSSNETTCQCTFDSSSSNSIVYEMTSELYPHQGLTVAVGWQKGIIPPPSAEEIEDEIFEENLGQYYGELGLGVLATYLFIAWFFVGRDPQTGTIVPRFDPPDGFSPAACRFVQRMGFDNKSFTASIVNMAVKGYLVIEHRKNKYVLKKVGDNTDKLTTGEKKIASYLFAKVDSVTLGSSYDASVSNAVLGLQAQLTSEFRKLNFKNNSGWMVPAIIIGVATWIVVIAFVSDNDDLFVPIIITSMFSVFIIPFGYQLIRNFRRAAGFRKIFAMIPILFFLGIFVVLPANLIQGVNFPVMEVLMTFGPYLLIFTGIVGLIILFFYLIQAPTVFGRKRMDEIEGLILFMNAAEKDRLNILNPPDKTPQLFERLLPYAIALGVENGWGKQFDSILQKAIQNKEYQPTWYVGDSYGMVRISSMTSGLGTTMSSAISTSSTPPSSSSSSGSSGGGSSGGGGGGGGGGGW